MFVIDRVNFKRACGEIVSKAIDKSRKFLDVFHLFGMIIGNLCLNKI